jgi:AraC-like DNA-binding protein/ligand-binding sensor protein
MQTILEMPELGSRTDLSDNDTLFGGTPAKRAITVESKNPFASPARPNRNNNNSRALVDAIVKSKLYRDYEKAFSEATGMPVALRPLDSWQLPLHGKRNENPFCKLMAQKSNTCAVCMQIQEELLDGATDEAKTVTCPAGMCDTAVPVRIGDQLIGFLQTGQVFRKKPTVSQFNRTVRMTEEWGMDIDRDELDQTFFDTKVISNKQHESVVKLLTIFAEHLSLLGNQLVMQQESSEPPVIARAKEYILQHHTDDISLGQVAKAVNTSTFYFCKMFKKVTGINFTDYLSRVRIEKSKELLLNRNLRVSEVAFEVGFQSLTHFNRVFKKMLGQSPTEYRMQLLGN